MVKVFGMKCEIGPALRPQCSNSAETVRVGFQDIGRLREGNAVPKISQEDRNKHRSLKGSLKSTDHLRGL